MIKSHETRMIADAELFELGKQFDALEERETELTGEQGLEVERDQVTHESIGGAKGEDVGLSGQLAGVPGGTVTEMDGEGRVSRDSLRRLALTNSGRATLWALLPDP